MPDPLPPTTPDPEARAAAAGEAARLVGTGFAAGVDAVRAVHEAVAGRTFDRVGPLGAGVRVAHDAISSGVYRSVRRAGMVAARTVAPWAARRARTSTASVREQLLVSAVNGAWGDALARSGSPLTLPTGWRRDEADLAPTRAAMAAAFPAPSEHLVVLVHGLCENEHSWRSAPPQDPDAPPRGFDRLLVRDLGASALVLRYNSGRHVSRNGAELADLVARTVEAWPVPVRRLSLVGHSMGGLLLRSALHVAGQRGDPWPALVGDLVTLGTPHRGAPLEQVVHAGGALMRRFGESAPLAALLETRSDGVKDLRHGYLLDEDWIDQDPAALLGDLGAEVVLPAWIRLHVVSAVLTRDPRHPVGRMLGDLLVHQASAAGAATRRRSVGFTVATAHHLPGTTHFHLLHAPAVYEVLLACLREDTRPAGTEPAPPG